MNDRKEYMLSTITSILRIHSKPKKIETKAWLLLYLEPSWIHVSSVFMIIFTWNNAYKHRYYLSKKKNFWVCFPSFTTLACMGMANSFSPYMKFGLCKCKHYSIQLVYKEYHVLSYAIRDISYMIIMQKTKHTDTEIEDKVYIK